MDTQTRFTNTKPDVWHGETLHDGAVVARARIEIDYEGQPTLTRLLLLDDDTTHAVTLLEAIGHRWPDVEWVPRIQQGDLIGFQRFFFLQHPDGGPYVVVGVLQHGVAVRLGVYDLTNQQVNQLSRNPGDYGEILGITP